MVVPTRASLLLAITILVLPMTLVLGRHVGRTTHSRDHSHHQPMWGRNAAAAQRTAELYDLERKRPRHGKPDTLQIAGSRLPDCSHACGSCSPCRLVMVSFVCASLQEAETCPMAYKCMCNSKSYPVP